MFKKALTPKMRYEIGRRANNGEKAKQLAKEVGIDTSTVLAYKAFYKYDNTNILDDQVKPRQRNKFNKTMIDEIMKDYNENSLTVYELYGKYGCSRTDFWNWKNHRYPDAYYLEIAENMGYNPTSAAKDDKTSCLDKEFLEKLLSLGIKKAGDINIKEDYEECIVQENWTGIVYRRKVSNMNKIIANTLRKYYEPTFMSDDELKKALNIPTTREELETVYRIKNY